MIRLGIMAPADIAVRRFLPALVQCNNFSFAGVAVCEPWEREQNDGCRLTEKQQREKYQKQLAKARSITNQYGGHIFYGYSSMAESDEVDAVYVPLPPALHYKWAKICLDHEKHILLEKPFTTVEQKTEKLLEIAKKKKLAVNENYMFVYHRQVDIIRNLIEDGSIGQVRLYEAKFGFPKRLESDFRYNRLLGGGALFDCGGYLLKSASLFLGNDYSILHAMAGKNNACEVDLYGSATLVNSHGEVMNIAYGMDNAYQCELRIWGSKAMLTADRFFTAPSQLSPRIELAYSDGTKKEILAEPCNTFQKSIEYFGICIGNSAERENAYKIVEKQAFYVEEFIRSSGLLMNGERQ